MLFLRLINSGKKAEFEFICDVLFLIYRVLAIVKVNWFSFRNKNQ